MCYSTPAPDPDQHSDMRIPPKTKNKKVWGPISKMLVGSGATKPTERCSRDTMTNSNPKRWNDSAIRPRPRAPAWGRGQLAPRSNFSGLRSRDPLPTPAEWQPIFIEFTKRENFISITNYDPTAICCWSFQKHIFIICKETSFGRSDASNNNNNGK